MTVPAIFFGVVLSSAFGTAFHFLKGGNLNKMIYYVLLAWLGFWAGHFSGAKLGWDFASVGLINTGMATLGSLFFLFVGDWLGHIEVSRK